MNGFSKTIVALVGMLGVTGLGAEEALVSFTGRLDNVACAAVCGNCCTGQRLTEINGGFGADVGASDVDLTSVLDSNTNLPVTGFFFQGTGQCGMGSCTLFHVRSVSSSADDRPSFTSSTGQLHLPEVVIDGGARYEATLGPPYDVLTAQLLGDQTLVQQAEDCSGEGVACAAGLTCVSYFGIAGANGPLFQTCEIPCESSASCPSGQQCIGIADGPGQVCRPVGE